MFSVRVFSALRCVISSSNSRNLRLLSSLANNEVVQSSQPVPFKPNVPEVINSDVAELPEAVLRSTTTVASNIIATYNVAAYVNQSELLQNFVKLGVEISKWDKQPAEFLAKLLAKDFKKDVEPLIRFFVDNHVTAEYLGDIFTKAPKLLMEDLSDLETRINYLKEKKFTSDAITRILTKNPYWLLFSVEALDSRLGFLQKTFQLNGKEVRQVTAACPRLITWKLWNIREMNFSIKEEMGFEKEMFKELFLKKPKLWITNRSCLVRRFDFAHNEMKLSHETILHFPHLLTTRDFRLKQRHLFLKFLGRVQYDPKKEMYVSPKHLVEKTDSEFCTEVAKSTVGEFNDFLKTL
uniref:EOG090X0C5Y n=1 Tax=Lynceus sp. MCZ IZ 141354 TaxID=1930659 RepID=A0A9N6WZ95_9CRUS|nr:EOG090X0C5Y [Lynceus sp. MCZ IZ 141354]